MRIANLLSIAGSDPSGGAGIQADLKTFAALGGYGTCVITALTAQNTRGVTSVQTVPTPFIAEQLVTLLADVRIDAIKIGMVASAEVAKCIADALRAHAGIPVVLDPVMVAKSGDPLVDDEAGRAVAERLLPHALVVTPNIYEAARLTGREAPTDLPAMHQAARDIAALGARYVLIKGGALDGTEATDVLLEPGGETRTLATPRVASQNLHGTGCALSSAIAALLPANDSPVEAIVAAKRYVTAAIEASDALSVGHGHGPVHHFHALWKS